MNDPNYYTEGHPGRRPGLLSSLFLKNFISSPVIFWTHLGSEFHRLHADQEKEQPLTFLAFSLVSKFGMSHLHPRLTCTLKVSPYLLEIFGTRPSFILYIYKILNLSCFLWMLYIGFFFFFQLFSIVQSIHTINLSGERSLCLFQEVCLVKVRRSRRPQWGAVIQA